MTPEQELYFDVDDLFYYSNHPIHTRQGYYFINDYGMQINLLSRYGIKNHSIEGKDYRFIDGNQFNYRYDNIEVMNPYNGIEIEQKSTLTYYKAKIHLKGNYIIGRYQNIHKAAIAYNKGALMILPPGAAKGTGLSTVPSRKFLVIQCICNWCSGPLSFKKQSTAESVNP